ncbi:MAG: PQQ-binding-like beta-propeller repeat protein [Verrucomicrobiae bacterium]|nr:PQQ-binding-like beta-propeller repeat protein [Verrucomicrobiae bacterium]
MHLLVPVRIASVSRWWLAVAGILLALAGCRPGAPGESDASNRSDRSNASQQPALPLLVLDPLARELACACVKGYAQRDYHQLAAWLSQRLNRAMRVEFFETLADVQTQFSFDAPLVLVAKAPEIAAAVASSGAPLHALCRLTDLEGKTTMTGLFVARRNDPARTLADLGGRRILFGPASAAETREAALAALRAAGVPPPGRIETRPANAEAALDVLDSPESPPPVAVISSYLLPLLEGCGSVQPGELRVIGQTEPVPFITVFVSNRVPLAEREKLREALLAVRKNRRLLRALESRDGFVPEPGGAPSKLTGTIPPAEPGTDWPDWRGLNRDARVPRLPDLLPDQPRRVWSKPALNGAMAGLAVAEGCVLVADRDPGDERDVFRCLDASTGELRWLVEYPAPGRLDYGQFPRATPVVRDGCVWLLGAFGDLRCVRLRDGKLLWKRHLVRDLGGRLPQWGASATPLLVDDLLIVNPGGPQASLVALEARTGRVRWKAPGPPAAYSSFIVATLGGQRQVVGLDAESLGGWDIKTGARLWRGAPPLSGDFNVPTPLVLDGKLFVATENNGARLYEFDPAGRIRPEPLATSSDLAPVTATPVAVGNRVFGSTRGLVCLDTARGLRAVWHAGEAAFDEHASFITDGRSVLAVALNGECVLLSVKADGCVIRSRVQLFEDGESWSHPAWAGDRLYVRGGASISCFDFSTHQR